MKKIAIVTDAWYPQVNGVVTAISHMQEFLEKSDFKVITIHPGLFRSIPVFFYPEIKLAVFAKKKLERILEKEKPNYIHLATEGPLGLAARAYCIKRKIKFTTSYHTNYPIYIKARVGAFYNLTYSYLKWFHSKSSRVMVATNTLKLGLKARGFKNLVIWPLGIDSKLFKKNPHAKVPEGLKTPIFMYFGRLAIEKNVEAFLKCSFPGSKLVIGDGPLKKSLEKKYNDKDTLFVGYKKGKSLVDLLSISDVFVLPSKTETFGLVILEALACELPVAAYNVMGPKDIITNGQEGFLGENLEENAIKCLKLPRKGLREKAIRFSWEKSADMFINNLIETNLSL